MSFDQIESVLKLSLISLDGSSFLNLFWFFSPSYFIRQFSHELSPFSLQDLQRGEGFLQ